MPDAARANFAVLVDSKSMLTAAIEQATLVFCAAYKLMPNVWILSSEQSVNAVRNHLVQALGKRDSLFVIDAARDKAAWFNFGPEVDVHIRRAWQRAPLTAAVND